MRFLKPEGLPYQDRLGNPIFVDFRNMVRMESVRCDDELDNLEKIEALIYLFYGLDFELPDNETDLGNLLNEISWFYSGGKASNNDSSQGSNEKEQIFDFEQDEELIVSAFLHEYQIDLTDPDIHIHWWKFLALFRGIRNNSELKQVMDIRQKDISNLKGEERKLWERQKRLVAIKKNNVSFKSIEEFEKYNIEMIQKRHEEVRAAKEKERR